MRIGFVSLEAASSMTSWSGIPFQILSQMRAQSVDVHMLSPLKSAAKYLLFPAKLMARVESKSITLDHFRLVLYDYARQIESFVKNRRIDVVFSTSTIPITLLDCGKPMVTWTDAVFQAMYGYYNEAFANMTRDAVARGNWQEETALRNCSCAAFASTWALDAARSLTGGAKLRVLPFGSSLPVQHTAGDVARRAAAKRSGRKNQCELLFVGVDWQRKGGDIAVETARLLNEGGVKTRLRIVGPPPGGVTHSFVEALGFINKSSTAGIRSMVDLFQDADFFILPTKAEAAGIVFSEASSYGLPSITYATGGVSDYVRNGVNGVCLQPGEPAARFAGEIQRILACPTEYVSYALGGFREYEERLNWEKSVKLLLGLCAVLTGQ